MPVHIQIPAHCICPNFEIHVCIQNIRSTHLSLFHNTFKLLRTASVLRSKDVRHGHFEWESESPKDLALLLKAAFVKTQLLDGVHASSSCSRHVCWVQLVTHSVLKHQPSLYYYITKHQHGLYHSIINKKKYISAKLTLITFKNTNPINHITFRNISQEDLTASRNLSQSLWWICTSFNCV